MNKEFSSLKELHEYYAENNDCFLKKSATQPVYETTLPSSGLLFIGEAPGKKEDLEGKPFVGSAGKFLDELLKSIGYSRQEVYVTNVVKYRPPNNRDPNDDEKKACRLWLNDELLFIKPKVIVTLGRHALAKFLPNSTISKSHGRLLNHKSGIPVFALYHPAVALYNGSYREILFNDMKNLKDFLDKENEKEEKQLKIF